MAENPSWWKTTTWVRCNLNSLVAAPLTQFNHRVSSLKYIGIEKVSLPPRGGDLDLARREHFWIYKIKTCTPHGLNIDYDLRGFL